MAKGGGKKRARKHRVSSGLGRMRRARKELRRVKMKIARWKRNQTDNTKVSTWRKFQNPRKRSRHNGWDTTGLEKRVKQLEAVIKKGKTNR